MPCDHFHFSPHPVLEKYQTSLYSKVFSAAKRGKIKYQASIASGPSSTCKILVSMLKLVTFTQIFSATKQGEKSKKKRSTKRQKNLGFEIQNSNSHTCARILSAACISHSSQTTKKFKIQNFILFISHQPNRQGKPTSQKIRRGGKSPNNPFLLVPKQRTPHSNPQDLFIFLTFFSPTKQIKKAPNCKTAKKGKHTPEV